MPTFSNVQKANCVIWLAETHDVQMVKTKFEQEFPKTNQPPSEPEIRKWYENFKKTGLYDEQEDGPNNELEHVSFESTKKVLDIFRKEVSGVDLHATDYEKDTGLLNFFGFRKIHKCHPYKMHLKGKPTKEDFDSRKIFAKVNFSKNMCQKHSYLIFSEKIIFLTLKLIFWFKKMIFLAESEFFGLKKSIFFKNTITLEKNRNLSFFIIFV